ncbi:hypothetical protein [Telluribacter sp.]|jgi:hypothetical protein|uniref:hypothetical protein n=1 Tax=Telluribacter sp. TaxID=1978767 RepID=UPI002E142C9D|nr:hypothetical protein [Telluribacter sp.]
MKKSEVSLATISWARDEPEELLLREALKYLAELDRPVFITDGGSGEEFLQFLAGFPHFSVFKPEVPGLWNQVKQSMAAARGTDSRFILYTEPDKADFFKSSLPRFIDQAPDQEMVGVVLASRSPQSFRTFPEFQQKTETTINNCCAEVIGTSTDYTYGPFLFNRDLLPGLDRLDGSIGWGWRPYLFGLAHRLGYRVEPLEMELPCPPDQREDTSQERLYRMRQLQQNIQGIVLSTTVPVP